MLRTASLLRRGRNIQLAHSFTSCSLSAHELLVLLSHSFHPPHSCPRHQHTLSSPPSSCSSSSPLPSSLPSPSMSSSRLHSSLASRTAQPSSPPPLPLSSAVPASSPSPSVSLLDGAPLPSSTAAERELLDRLRPLLYLELSRLASHSTPASSFAPHPTTSASPPAPSSASATTDWLSAVDVDVICSHVLRLIRAQHRAVSSREVVRLTVNSIMEQMRAADEVGRVVERIGAVEDSRRLKERSERSEARKEPKFALDRLRQQWDERRSEQQTQQRGQQPQQGMQAIDRVEAGAVAATGGSGRKDRRVLTVPLHRHPSTIFTTSPTVLQPSSSSHQPDTSTSSSSPSTVSASSSTPSAGRTTARCPSTLFQLYNEQLQLETLALNEAVADYAEVTKTVVNMQKGAQLRPAQRMMLGWYGPLVAAIEKEQERARKRTAAGASAVKLLAAEAHLPYLLHLPAPQLAVLTMHTMLSMALARDSKSDVDGVKFVSASQQVGQAVNLEAKMASMRKEKQKMRQFLASVVNADGGNSGATGSDVLTSPNVLSKLRTSKKNAWSDEVCVKLGAALLQLLISTAAVPDMPKSSFTPAFSHQTVWNEQQAGGRPSSGMRQHGVIVADERVTNTVLRDHEATEAMLPKLKPMIVTPRPWKSHDDGGYLSVATRVMRSHGSHMQQEAVSKGDLTLVYKGLNYLGGIPWRINSRVLEVVEAVWERGGGVAELPSLSNVPLPTPPSAEVDSSTRRQLKRAHSAVVVQNRNLHSLRCDVNLKLSVARQFNRRTIYFPFNLDFRGRAYPIPPHLNHIGNDLCRGLLTFEEKKRLGERGVRWLKIHTTNLWGQGKEKLPYDERVAWCDDNMHHIRQAATAPLPAGTEPLTVSSAWWLAAEKPFEFIASCIELHAALSSPSPVDYMSSLPVHQDGSCNGLQHYAALGRDVEGGMAVNLTPSDRPQDVYTVVCKRVLDKVREDAAAGNVLAKALEGKVTRKIVKQTVMTSVYGVTLIGARDQIKARLAEATNIAWPAPAEQSLEQGALYLAKTTLSSLYTAFGGARLIQDWLSLCANAMSSVQQPVSWLTPLGLPVIQPYRRQQSHSVQTIMQQVSLADHSDLLPVSSQRQRSAFPPNFIHSLDATHMLMTAIQCQQAGLTFTAVHDSYWTHAGDMDKMGRMLREEFVRLYEQPILERVRTEWEKRFPELEIEPLPKRGSLDLKQIIDSPYFFN